MLNNSFMNAQHPQNEKRDFRFSSKINDLSLLILVVLPQGYS